MGLTRLCKVPSNGVGLGWSNQISGAYVHHRLDRNATAVLCAVLDPACCGC